MVTYVPIGPVVDNRPAYSGTYFLRETVGPSRVMIQCEEPFTAAPELQDGIIMGFMQNWYIDYLSSWNLKWFGNVGIVEFQVGALWETETDPGIQWVGVAFSLIAPLAQLWYSPPADFTQPRLPWAIEGAFPPAAPLKVTPISEWVNTEEQFPFATNGWVY